MSGLHHPNAPQRCDAFGALAAGAGSRTVVAPIRKHGGPLARRDELAPCSADDAVRHAMAKPMRRAIFLRLAGTFHVLLGAFFFLFTREATELMIDSPDEHMHLLVKGLSGIVAAFGIMSLMASNATPGRALNAILSGTLLYLLFTVTCDIAWLNAGLLRQIAWLTIGMRAALAVGYGYHLWKGFERLRERPAYGQRAQPL